MPIALLSFFQSDAASCLSDDALRAALAKARVSAPDASAIEVRALDETFLEMRFADARAQPEVRKAGDPQIGPPLSAAVATLRFDDALDNVELKSQQAAQAVHAALNARGTGVFDPRRHLDLVGADAMPTLQAITPIRRRASMDRDAFIQYYRTHHVPLAKSLQPRFTRYSTFRLLEAFGDLPVDCVTLQEYPSREELIAHLNTRVRSDDVAHNDVGNFVAELAYQIGERTITEGGKH